MKRQKERLTILVSSTVYGIEELLERIYFALTNYGYDVWMSHKGTMPILPDRSNLQNCLDAVRKCNLFLGIITTQYGSSATGGKRSITHEELLKAIELKKPRWILAHNNVVFARSLFRKLRCKNAKERRAALRRLGYNTAKKIANLNRREQTVIDDLRVLDMYEDAIRHDIKLRHRQGHWVQRYVTPEDAQLFATEQFYRYQEVEDFLEKHLCKEADVRRSLTTRTQQ